MFTIIMIFVIVAVWFFAILGALIISKTQLHLLWSVIGISLAMIAALTILFMVTGGA